MLRLAALLAVLAACDEHGKSLPKSDAPSAGDAAVCAGFALVGQVRDFTNGSLPGTVTFTLRSGGAPVSSGANGGFALCGPGNGLVADVVPPAGMLPGIAVAPAFGTSADDSYHVLVFSQAEATALFAQFGEPFDPAAGQVLVHQVLGQLQPTLTGAAGPTLAGLPPDWMVGNSGAFLMYTNVAPGTQRFQLFDPQGPTVFVPVEAGHVTYLMSLIVPD